MIVDDVVGIGSCINTEASVTNVLHRQTFEGSRADLQASFVLEFYELKADLL